jgi:DNA-binding IscR family transcriptional regulator
MTAIETILYKDASYARFRIAIRVVQEIMAAAPDTINTAQLEQRTGSPPATLARVCASLSRAGILTQSLQHRDAWLPGHAAAGATLADILCCEIDCRSGRRERPAQTSDANAARRQDMDAFVLQATMKINQIILEQLREFPLKRLFHAKPDAVSVYKQGWH